MIFDKLTWAEFGLGFFVYDGVISDLLSGVYGFVLVEEEDPDYPNPHRDPLPKTIVLIANPSEPMDSRFYSVEFEDFDFTTIGYSSRLRDFVAVDTVRTVYSYRNEESLEEIEGDLGHGGYSSTISKTVSIDGDVYAVGGPLKIYKKLGLNAWEDITRDVIIPEEFFGEYSSISLGFEDMAGFSKSDMYAVGEDGMVWHYDGKQWSKIAFPSYVLLETVVCANDANVYITDKNGSVWVGRESTWTKRTESKMSLPFFDSAWFSGRLWCANDYGMWVLEDDKLVPAEKAKENPLPEDMLGLCHRIDISPDGEKMLICGYDGAAIFDGQLWSILFDRRLLED